MLSTAEQLDQLLPAMVARLGPCTASTLTLALPVRQSGAHIGETIASQRQVERWLCDHPEIVDHNGHGWIARRLSTIAPARVPTPAAVERPPPPHRGPRIDAPAAGKNGSGDLRHAKRIDRLRSIKRRLSQSSAVSVHEIARWLGVSYCSAYNYCRDLVPVLVLSYDRTDCAHGRGTLMASLREEPADAG